MQTYDIEYSGSVTRHKTVRGIHNIITFLRDIKPLGRISITANDYEVAFGSLDDVLSSAEMAREYGYWSIADGTNLPV